MLRNILFCLLPFVFMGVYIASDSQTESGLRDSIPKENILDKLATKSDLAQNFQSQNTDSAIHYYTIISKKAQIALQEENAFLTDTLQKIWAQALDQLGMIFFRQGDTDKVIQYFRGSLEVLQQTEDNNLIARVLNNIGFVYNTAGEIDSALHYWHLSLETRRKTGDKLSIGNVLNNIGTIHHTQGNIILGLEYLTKSLKIREETGDSSKIAESLTNLGFIHRLQGDTLLALEYYKRSLSINESLKDKNGVATSLNNIAFIYRMQDKLDSALELYTKSLEISKELQDNRAIARGYNNIGAVHREKGNWNKALEKHEKSLELFEKLSDIRGKRAALMGTGRIAFLQGKTQLARTQVMRSHQYSLRLESPEEIRSTAELLREIHSALGRYQEAYYYFETEIRMRDSILNEQNLNSTLKAHFSYEYEKQAAIDSLAHAAEIEIKSLELAKLSAEKRKQSIFNYALLIVVVIVLSFSLVLYRLFREKQKVNLLLRKERDKTTAKNTELFQANEEIQSQRNEISAQRDTVIRQMGFIEKQNKDIHDGINYAYKLQQTVFPSRIICQSANAHTHNQVKDGYIFFKPKEVVSGDFYWYNKVKDQCIYVVADCTGHGVPGAFMSMLGVSFLNEIINKQKEIRANEILNQLRNSVQTTIQQKGNEEDTMDGMELAIIVLDLENMEMQFSGSRSPVWVIRNNALHKYKGDNYTIGINKGKDKPFTNQIISLQKNDSIYLFTDGYIDQLGAQTHRRYNSVNFHKLLLRIHSENMKNQQNILEDELNQWMGDYEQIDDITILCLKV